MQPSYEEIDTILRPLASALAREADVILDLRQLLISQGHPGKCVRCFFQLFEAAESHTRSSLANLQAWLEQSVEISVCKNLEEIEVLPFRLRDEESLESFCMRSIDTIRMDRDHGSHALALSFRYKILAA